MRNYILYLILIFPILVSAQETDSVTTEKFDFDIYRNKVRVFEHPNGWRLKTDSLEYREYPPDSSYYYVKKLFYPSGSLREKGKFIPPFLKIGKWEYYDEQGYLTKVVDEDARFGKVKPEDILMFAKKMSFLAKADTYYNLIVKDSKGKMRVIKAASTFNYINDNDSCTNHWKLRIFGENLSYTFCIDGDTGDIKSSWTYYMDGSGRGGGGEDGRNIFAPLPPRKPLTRPQTPVRKP